MLYANLDSGLANKADELSALFSERNPDIVIFNEVLPKRTRVKRKLTEKDFHIDGYEFVIRSITEGRGVIIYFKQCFNIQSVDILTTLNFEESIWIRIKLVGCDSLLVGNIYRSPSSTKENNDMLNAVLEKAVSQNDTHLLLVGDFNFGGLNWELLQSNESSDHSSSTFMEKTKDLFLYQHVEETTRHRMGQSPSRLDLLFTNEVGMINDLEYLPPIGASDHVCLVFKFICYTETKMAEDPRPNFFKGNYSAMKEDFNQTSWKDVDSANIETFWENFLVTINSAIDKHVPKVKLSKKCKKKPWLNRDSIVAIQKKKSAWKKYIHCKTDTNFQRYAEFRNKATRACRLARKMFETEIACNIKTDSKSFWNYVRSKSKTRTGIGDLESESLLTTDRQKAELLNSFFL